MSLRRRGSCTVATDNGQRERAAKRQARLCDSDCNCGDNEAHFKVTAIECDLIYNPISIIIDDDVCARFDHAMNLHINTNLRRQRLGQPNAKQSQANSPCQSL